MKKYDFDELIDRTGTNCLKHDALETFFRAPGLQPLWVADMDFRTPDFIMQAIRKRAEHEILGYTFRSDSYFNAIIGWMKRRHDWDIQKEWISFSPGVVAGLTLGIETFTKPGDGVIVQPPVYFPFFDSIKGSKRRMIENPLKIVDGRYTFDLDDLKAKIDDNTKLLMLCNPQNPGGMVWTRDELVALTDICLENDIMIISDEIHSDLVYKTHHHIPLASLSEEVKNNCMITMAPSKTFNVAGLSTSLVIIPNKTKMARYERTIGVPHLHMGNIFGTVAAEAAYSSGDEWLNQLVAYLWKNYTTLEKIVGEMLPRVKVMKPEATYLIWLDFSAYGMNNEELMKFVIEKAGLALNDGGRFGTGGEGWLRVNIGCPNSELERAMNKLVTAFSAIETQ